MRALLSWPVRLHLDLLIVVQFAIEVLSPLKSNYLISQSKRMAVARITRKLVGLTIGDEIVHPKNQGYLSSDKGVSYLSTLQLTGCLMRNISANSIFLPDGSGTALNVTTLGLSSIIILHRLLPAKPVAVRSRHHNGLRVVLCVGDGRGDNTSDPARRSQPYGLHSYLFPQQNVAKKY